ncbi:MAG: hypothetical protein AB8G17_10275, partial [Gammaproteobacteria bacterium]
MLSFFGWTLVFVGTALAVGYRREDLRSATIALGVATGAFLLFSDAGTVVKLLALGASAGLAALNSDEFRRSR